MAIDFAQDTQNRLNNRTSRLVCHIDQPQVGYQESFSPQAEIQEAPDACYVFLDLPGIDSSDISIEVFQDSVLVSGYRPACESHRHRAILETELTYGRFERLIQLPTAIDCPRVHAEYTHGILRLQLPKASGNQ